MIFIYSRFDELRDQLQEKDEGEFVYDYDNTTTEVNEN